MDDILRISRAGLDDVPELCRLLTVLFTQEAEFKPDLAAQERGLRAILQAPQIGQILLARHQGHAIGMVSLLYTISTALGGRVALLEDMVIDPLARNLGVGSRLLEQAIAAARAADCLRVTLLTDADNVGAQRFYQRAGFLPSPMIPLRLPLG
jgi:GNAT superfamily N-acetyltransferase